MVQSWAGLLLVRPGCKREQDSQRRGECAVTAAIAAAVELCTGIIRGAVHRVQTRRREDCIDRECDGGILRGDFRHHAAPELIAHHTWRGIGVYASDGTF